MTKPFGVREESEIPFLSAPPACNHRRLVVVPLTFILNQFEHMLIPNSASCFVRWTKVWVQQATLTYPAGVEETLESWQIRFGDGLDEHTATAGNGG